MSQNEAAAEEGQPDEGRYKCALPCAGSLFGDQPDRLPAARWWWCPLDNSSIENEEESEEQIKITKSRNLTEGQQAGRKQKRNEKTRKKDITIRKVIDKAQTKLSKMQTTIEKWNKDKDKAQAKIYKTRIELKKLQTKLENMTRKANDAKKQFGRTQNVPKMEVLPETPQTLGNVEGSFRPQLSTEKTILNIPMSRVFNMRVAVAAFLIFNMFLVEVFGYLLFYT